MNEGVWTSITWEGESEKDASSFTHTTDSAAIELETKVKLFA